jgi:pimeloyl-ACP methyl ester carboxylesterase
MPGLSDMNPLPARRCLLRGGTADLHERWANARSSWSATEIKVPTLIVRGEWDSYSTDADAKWLFERLWSLAELVEKRTSR